MRLLLLPLWLACEDRMESAHTALEGGTESFPDRV